MGRIFLTTGNSFLHIPEEATEKQRQGIHIQTIFLQRFYDPISYFLHLMYTFFLASQLAFGYSQRQLQRIWENQFYNKQGWILPLSIIFTFYSYWKLHIALAVNFQTKHLICEQHINDTSNIQKTTIANNNLSEDLKKQI